MSIFPPDFTSRMRTTLGPAFDAFELAHQSPSPVTIRHHRLKSVHPLLSTVPWAVDGEYLAQRPAFTFDPLFHGGAYYVQEASSMFLEQAIRQMTDAQSALRVLDLCAAPGGKSTHLLSLLSSDSLLISNEVIQSRATVLSENIQKWGYPNVLVTNNDPSDFQRIPGYFDLMVIDAPCSGEGLFRKDADAMQEWSMESAERCALRQRRILSDVWPALKEDGILVYCTCTYNDQENEETLAWLSQQRDVQSVQLKTEPAWGVSENTFHGITGYHFMPHLTRGEGFFLSVLRKKSAEPAIRMKSRFVFPKPPTSVQSQLATWINEGAPMKLISRDDLVMMVPENLLEEISWISEKLKILTKGTALATVKHEKLIPEHAAALSVRLAKDHFEMYPVNKEDAIAFLRKDNTLPADGRKGFALVTFEDLPLGWVNLLGNRLNNLYPSGWRIRKGS